MKALHQHISKLPPASDLPQNLDIGERIIYDHDASAKQKFIESLRDAAQQTLDAGCDLVFHCTGRCSMFW